MHLFYPFLLICAKVASDNKKNNRSFGHCPNNSSPALNFGISFTRFPQCNPVINVSTPNKVFLKGGVPSDRISQPGGAGKAINSEGKPSINPGKLNLEYD